MQTPDVDYNTWHQDHEREDDISTSWHAYVKKNLEPADTTQTSILEIGCGRGGFSNYLSALPNRPLTVHACDYSEAALKIACNNYTNSNIVWRKEDIMNLSFNSSYFDTAISCETIEHIPNPAKAIHELYRVLKPGGKLILTCPNYFNLFGIWCIYRWMIGKPFTEGGQPYVNYILMPMVFFWIRNAGFKIERFDSIDLVLPARVPKHYYIDSVPWALRIFGFRTFYVLRK